MPDYPCDCGICQFDKKAVSQFLFKVFGIEWAMVSEETHLSDFGWSPENKESLKQFYGVELPLELDDTHYLWMVLEKVGCKRREEK